ncbi:hypothetical protein [Mycolicibacterium sp. 624]|uniref:hypothetical protein n=1 Tax=Mycolicibacterium sp. 624 TaxID=3156314 RepID=UPI0033956AE4
MALAVAVARAGTHRDSGVTATRQRGGTSALVSASASTRATSAARGTLANMSQPAAGGVVETFRDFSRSTKVAIWVMLALGAVLFAVCLIADLAGADWMKAYAYIPNILAGLTGFLVGVPFALVVLATLASQRDEKAAADRVDAVSQIAWNQFRDAISTLCSPERIEAIERGAGRVQSFHDETWHGFNVDIAKQSAEEFQNLVAFAERQSERWGGAIQSLMADVGTQSDLTLQWFAAVRDWNTLDQYVRLQRLERGLQWFHRELDALLQERMIADRHPMRRFFEMHDADYGPQPGQLDNIASAVGAIASLKYRGYDQETFDRVARESTAHFPTTRVHAYYQTVMDVAHGMGMLYAFVQQIDRSGWPAVAPENPPLAS